MQSLIISWLAAMFFSSFFKRSFLMRHVPQVLVPLLGCSLCTGFYAGLVWYLLSCYNNELQLCFQNLFSFMIVASVNSYVVDLVLSTAESRLNHQELINSEMMKDKSDAN